MSCNLNKLEQTLDTYKHSKKTYQEQLLANSRPKRLIKSANRNKESTTTTGSQDICLLSAYDVVGKLTYHDNCSSLALKHCRLPHKSCNRLSPFCRPHISFWPFLL